MVLGKVGVSDYASALKERGRRGGGEGEGNDVRREGTAVGPGRRLQ